MYYLSCDLGTSSFKCLLFNENGQSIDQYFHFYDREWQTESLWGHNWEKALDTSLLYFQSYLPQIRAITVSGQGPCSVFLDAQYRVLRIYNWQKKYQAIHSSSMFLPHILHFRQHEPQLYQKYRYFICAPDYILFLLGAPLVNSLIPSSLMPYFWSDKDIDLYHIDKTRLAPFVFQYQILSSLHYKKYKQKHIYLINASWDYLSALLGSGVYKAEQLLDRTGTSEGLNYLLPSHYSSIPHKSFINEHIIPSQKIAYHNLSWSGYLFETFIHFFQLKGSRGQIVDQALGRLGKKNLPFFLSTNNLFTLHSSLADFFSPVHSDYDSLDYLYALLEALCFEANQYLLQLKSQKLHVQEWIMSGGQVYNLPWLHLKSSILKYPIKVSQVPHSELLGNFIISQKVFHHIPSWQNGIQRFIQLQTISQPNPLWLNFLEERFFIYQKKILSKE